MTDTSSPTRGRDDAVSTTTNPPVPTPPPSEPAPSLRPVEELQALCDAATLGPWYVCLGDRVQSSHEDRWTDDDGTEYVDHPFVCDTDSAMEETQHPEQDEANARFIAAARTALPALLARLRAAEETLAAVELALHLNDWEPINPPDEPGGYTAAYVNGWDAAVDHMHDLARAALAEGASR